jgi:drug/metabolite transporter (DMT)-like permease
VQKDLCLASSSFIAIDLCKSASSAKNLHGVGERCSSTASTPMSEWHASTLVLLLATPGGMLLTRSARKHNANRSTLSVNLVAELLKLSVATIVFLRDRQPQRKQKGLWALRTWLLCLLPAVLYLLQNVFVMQALTLLPASLHAALSNFKVLFTALVSRAVLGTRFSWQTSLSLAVLTIAACSVYWTAFEGEL